MYYVVKHICCFMLKLLTIFTMYLKGIAYKDYFCQKISVE